MALIKADRLGGDVWLNTDNRNAPFMAISLGINLEQNANLNQRFVAFNASLQDYKVGNRYLCLLLI